VCSQANTICQNNTCVGCGGAGQPCCEGMYCAPGHRCTNGNCR
jgi:hypothetical protein